jgi:protein-tyrosine phosphatase
MDKKIKNVLFMCFGNTARSPAAEKLAQHIKEKKYPEKLKDVEFESAGFFSVFKTPRPGTISYIKEKTGRDMDSFQGKKVDEKLLEQADLILVMQNRHLKRLRRKYAQIPEIEKKSFIIKEFIGDTKEIDIPDPVDLTDDQYREIMEEVHRAVKLSLQKIIQINNS